MDSIIYTYSAVILLLLFLSAIYSVAETSMTSISLPRLHKLKSEGHPKAIIVTQLREEKEMLLASLLIASTALDTIASAVAVALAVQWGGVMWIPFATAIMTFLIVVISDILPKTIAFEYPVKSAFAVAGFIKISIKILYPFSKIIQYIVKKIFILFRIQSRSQAEIVGGDEMLRGAVEMGHSLGILMKDDKEMLDGVLSLAECRVRDIMTPKHNICSYNINLKPSEMLKQMLDTGHSRFPLWEGAQDNIIGIVYLKDLFNLSSMKKKSEPSKKDIKSILNDPWFVTGVTLLSDQLKQFRAKKIHFAIVVDEYGSMQGIVSLEDVLEEIVGNIDDEHDVSVDSLYKLKGGWYSVNGELSVRDVNKALGWSLPDDVANTIAGLLIHQSEVIPNKGDEFEFDGIKFIVTNRKRNKIVRLKIKELNRSV